MKRTKKEIIARMNEIGVQHRLCLGGCPAPSGERTATPPVVDEETRTIPFVIVSADNAGERYDWWEGETYIEELSIEGAHYGRLKTFFTDHRPSVDNAAGRVDNTRPEAGTIKCDVQFAKDQRSYDIYIKYRDGILTDVSIGYIINDVIVTSKKDEPDHVLVTDYEVVELSAVWRGFDAGAGVGRSVQTEMRGENDSQTPDPTPTPESVMDGRDMDVLTKQLQLKGKQR